MGRYEQYKKQKPTQKNKLMKVRKLIIVILLAIAITGLIIQVVMNL